MKKDILIKTAIASAVIAATTATTIADTTLYGRMRGGLVCTDGLEVADGSDDCALVNRSSRFGIKVNQPINDSLTAFGRYEFGVNLDEGGLGQTTGPGGTVRNNNATNRLAYVGLKGGFGEFSIGTRWSPMYTYVTSPVDPFQLLGGTSGINQYSQTFRVSDTLNYKNKFGSVGMHLQVQMDESGVEDNDFDQVQIGGGGTLGAFNWGLAYRDLADVSDSLGVHGGAKLGGFDLGLSYFNTNEDGALISDHDEWMGIASYGFGGGRKATLGFTSIDFDEFDADPYSISLEYEHKLTKNFHWFAAIQNTDLDTPDVDDVFSYGAGMRLEF